VLPRHRALRHWARVTVVINYDKLSDQLHHFDCVRAPKALARLRAAEARIATGLPRLNAAETARLESTATKARLDERIANIEAKCHVSAPSGSSLTAPQSNAGHSADTAAATA
jgi:hypothetical protein